MEWFHFSDFHIGKPKGPQTVALASLIDAVKEVCLSCSGQIDAVFITGDIAYSGKSEEYEKFKNEFLIPLSQINAFSNAVYFAVPGNHDVDCDATLPITWDSIGIRNQHLFFNENEDGQKVRASRAVVFKNYWNFVSENNILSPNPMIEVTSFMPMDDFPFDILASNLAFFSDRDKDSTGEFTPSPIDSLNLKLTKRTVSKPIVILGHHPLGCFLKPQQVPFSTFLKEKKAVFLHGHEHLPSISFNRDGSLKTLGFGASYLASQQDQTVAPYFNTFTHCCLEKKLILRCFSWQCSPGKWIDTTKIQLPESMPDGIMSEGPGEVLFPFPDGSLLVNATVLRKVNRSAPKPIRLFPIDSPSEALCKRLFLVSSNLRSIFQKEEPKTRINKVENGKLQMEFELENGKRNLFIFIGAVNHILSSKEVEALNTELDTEGFESATVISLGKISADAKAMYLRLQTRKPIEIIVSESLAAEANMLLTDQQRMVVATLDAAKQSICLLLGQEDLFLLIIDEDFDDGKFYIVNGNGTILVSTDPIVNRLRKADPEFNALRYSGENTALTPSEENKFVELQYLENCHKEYNVMKYAALANVGLRFSDLPFEELYVNATACEVSENSALRPEQFIDDHLSAYPFSEELREHIHSQLLANVDQNERQETSQAREFCQKFNAVLITGDPGSGKTCFVKSEILAYCKRAIDGQDQVNVANDDWHSSHIPIMVSLSEVVAEKDLDDIGLFPILSRLLERRGLLFPVNEMLRFTALGRIAFFFDGLDEVVSVEKRAQVVRHINGLVEKELMSGNRVVVTSRPAAMQVVNLLPTLHKLELQGLSNDEIRFLAGRILTLKLSSSQDEIQLNRETLGESDSLIINQLIDDCSKSPGVSRMAQNPLLLTLLIMIYANSGALSAKRHKIYEEAIKTLASVRGREAGHQPISVQDLRERLGALAVSVYKKESGLLPQKSEVCEVIKSVMERQRGEIVSLDESVSFVQKVAESTGLIVLGSRKNEENGNGIVSFMHHSFLEYFAAIGLSRELESIDISAYVREPRWREILTLLAGIIGENEDVSPIIRRFLEAGKSEPDVDAKLLLFAIDCALECEVPSETAQRMLAIGIKDCLKNGPGRQDPWVRAEIGQRLKLLLSVCGGGEFDGMLIELMNCKDETIIAASIEVAGHAFIEEPESSQIRQMFEIACQSSEESILSAICLSVSKTKAFRTRSALNVISSCLKRTIRCRKAAFEALSKLPSLASEHWGEILNGIDDKNSHICRMASIAALNAGLNVDVISLNSTRKDILIRALNSVANLCAPEEFRHIQVKKDTLSRLLCSPQISDRILGIRLLPLGIGDEKYVFGTLIELIRNSESREEVVASLTALSWGSSLLALASIGDLRTFVKRMNEGTADIRLAAIRLLGYFGKDLLAVESLLNGDFSSLGTDEYYERLIALSRAKTEKDRVRAFIFDELGNCLSSGKKMNKENIRRIVILLDSARRLGENAPTSLVGRIFGLIGNYQIDPEIQRKAILCFPAIAMPSHRTVEQVIHLFKKPPFDMETELVQLPSILAMKCRKSVDYVVASVSALAELRNSLIGYHSSLLKRQNSEQNEFFVTELRSGINDLTQIIVAFKDFIDCPKSKINKP